MTEKEIKKELIETKEEVEMEESKFKNAISKAGGFVTKHRKKLIAGAMIIGAGVVAMICKNRRNDDLDVDYIDCDFDEIDENSDVAK